jgi:nucleoside triphosphate diphosphatase
LAIFVSSDNFFYMVCMTGKPDSIATLVTVMAALRHPETGCPWDKQQDFATIAPYTIEEAYEVQAAIKTHDPVQIKDELGDLLFQVVYHARMAEERGWFDLNDVAATISDKMIRRHPHVFGDAPDRDASAQTHVWEALKAAERSVRAEAGTLDGIASTLPALAMATKLTGRAARVGFDWPDADAVLDKLEEEIKELRAELPTANAARMQDELGDMLFVLANLARKLKLNAEACLNGANEKFTRRFRFIEAALATEGKAPADSNLAEMDRLWDAAKHASL